MSEPSNSGLADRLRKAIEEYRSGWQPVDDELYELCHRRASHRDCSDVYTKVAMIGRVYQAGIARSFRGTGNAEITVARGLIAQADLLEEQVVALGGRRIDRQVAPEVVALHGRITKDLAGRTGNIWLTSFISKYLHFHCPIVPVYDSKAAGSIGSFVKGSVYQRAVADIRASLADQPVSSAYRNFVAAFVVLYEQAWAETLLEPSVKEVDYMLLKS